MMSLGKATLWGSSFLQICEIVSRGKGLWCAFFCFRKQKSEGSVFWLDRRRILQISQVVQHTRELSCVPGTLPSAEGDIPALRREGPHYLWDALSSNTPRIALLVTGLTRNSLSCAITGARHWCRSSSRLLGWNLRAPSIPCSPYVPQLCLQNVSWVCSRCFVSTDMISIQTRQIVGGRKSLDAWVGLDPAEVKPNLLLS